MEPLMPKQAAEIALKAYVVEDVHDIKEVHKEGGLGVEGEFSVDNATVLRGVSGSIFFNSNSGFGYIAQGIGSRKNEALVAIRGTASRLDCLTDLNMALEVGGSGYLVHVGFNRTFQSFKQKLEECINILKPHSVHVVGHSLGGALATLTADYLQRRCIKVKLYTFGAPRSGVGGHAEYLTTKLLADNIYRVYHSADPVPMVPIFPFQHIPVTTNIYFLPCNSTICFQAHRISGYVRTIGESDWKGLSVINHQPSWNKSVEDYLKYLESEGGVTMLSGASLRMILYALDAIIKDIIGTTGLVFAAGVTVIDRLARILYSGMLTTKKIAENVERLISAILKFTGRGVAQVANVSVAFISWVLNLLVAIVSNAATRALSLLGPSQL